jgi:hypothetical protein
MEQNTNGTQSYARLHRRGLTVAQQSAVDLLASGKTDTETAKLLKLARPTVSKWRLYDPVFAAALNERRAEVWGAGLDRLRSLIPQALDALAEALGSRLPPAKFKAARAILGLVKLPVPAASGLTSAEEIIAALVQARVSAKRAEREKYLSKHDRFMASINAPNKAQAEADESEARAEVLAELEAKLSDEGGANAMPDPSKE